MRGRLLMAAWCVFGTGAGAAASPAPGISFARDIVPVFKSRCVMCHLPGTEPGGLALHPRGGYANLVGVKSTESPLLRVVPGKAEDSYLYRKLAGTHVAAGGTGEPMPFGEPPLSQQQIDAIRQWIEKGAKDN